VNNFVKEGDPAYTCSFNQSIKDIYWHRNHNRVQWQCTQNWVKILRKRGQKKLA